MREKFYVNMNDVRACLTDEWKSKEQIIRESNVSPSNVNVALKDLIDKDRVECKNGVLVNETGRKIKGWRRKVY